MDARNKPEVVVTALWPTDLEAKLGSFCKLRIRKDSSPLRAEELAELIGDADAVMTTLNDKVTEVVFASCKNLKVVANVAVGFDNIDLEAAKRAGVWVTNTPGVLTEATADLAWALLLAVTRRVLEADKFTRRGEFRGWRPDLFLGSGLQGKTLGVVGYGRIGRAVARRGRAFGMRVIYADPEEREDTEDQRVELNQLLSEAHVVTLHCPLNPSTKGLIGWDQFKMMRRGAYLINTARGEVVDEEALVRALEEGILAGAGLDVYQREPQVHPKLLKMDNVVLLPHIGSATVETRGAMARLAAENVLAVLSGRTPPTPVVKPEEPR